MSWLKVVRDGEAWNVQIRILDQANNRVMWTTLFDPTDPNGCSRKAGSKRLHAAYEECA